MRVIAHPTVPGPNPGDDPVPAPAPGNTYLGDQLEFNLFRNLYARYEVVGMKAEVSINARTTMVAANLVGGFAPRMPDVALFPVD